MYHESNASKEKRKVCARDTDGEGDDVDEVRDTCSVVLQITLAMKAIIKILLQWQQQHTRLQSWHFCDQFVCMLGGGAPHWGDV